jgi:MFS family permease
MIWRLGAQRRSFYGSSTPGRFFLVKSLVRSDGQCDRVLPLLALMFLSSFLDRTNVGNAKILGLEEDLNLTNDQYANGLAIFFAFYIAAELPSNLVLKRVTPRIWLSSLTMAWGVVGMCLGFVRNYGGFLAVRAVLGLTEGGLLPGSVRTCGQSIIIADKLQHGPIPLKYVYQS